MAGLLQDKNDGEGLVYSGEEEDQIIFTCWPEDESSKEVGLILVGWIMRY
jgi:hypothetical protein